MYAPPSAPSALDVRLIGDSCYARSPRSRLRDLLPMTTGRCRVLAMRTYCTPQPRRQALWSRPCSAAESCNLDPALQGTCLDRVLYCCLSSSCRTRDPLGIAATAMHPSGSLARRSASELSSLCARARARVVAMPRSRFCLDV